MKFGYSEGYFRLLHSQFWQRVINPEQRSAGLDRGAFLDHDVDDATGAERDRGCNSLFNIHVTDAHGLAG